MTTRNKGDNMVLPSAARSNFIRWRLPYAPALTPHKRVVFRLSFHKDITGFFEEQYASVEVDNAQGADLEHPDEYCTLKLFWVPPEARWSSLKAHGPQPSIGYLRAKQWLASNVASCAKERTAPQLIPTTVQMRSTVIQGKVQQWQ